MYNINRVYSVLYTTLIHCTRLVPGLTRNFLPTGCGISRILKKREKKVNTLVYTFIRTWAPGLRRLCTHTLSYFYLSIYLSPLRLKNLTKLNLQKL